MTDKAELGPGIPRRKELEATNAPPTSEEKGGLQRRRGAAELEGCSDSPVDVRGPGIIGDRTELEALRHSGSVLVEMD